MVIGRLFGRRRDDRCAVCGTDLSGHAVRFTVIGTQIRNAATLPVCGYAHGADLAPGGLCRVAHAEWPGDGHTVRLP